MSEFPNHPNQQPAIQFFEDYLERAHMEQIERTIERSEAAAVELVEQKRLELKRTYAEIASQAIDHAERIEHLRKQLGEDITPIDTACVTTLRDTLGTLIAQSEMAFNHQEVTGE